MTTIMHLEGGVVVNLGEAKGQYQYLSQEFNRRGLSSHHWSVLTNLYQKAEAATALRARVVELTSDKQHLRDCVERLCRGWARDRFLQREEASEAQVQDYVDRHWRLLVPAAYAQLV